ncbi:hypothetical protein [Streptomyces rishiriensis]|uniref:Uncharacterized protein n=1 Tax=Streptomyces rishiriensis TaxID=68264 RepID=A0ABU0NI43_STRRH|nr:hypothetical protein [Streptomyces rishiriensis]MDQ0578503.1 hypothetical protein [Streptomyces rishiriensis]
MARATGSDIVRAFLFDTSGTHQKQIAGKLRHMGAHGYRPEL